MFPSSMWSTENRKVLLRLSYKEHGVERDVSIGHTLDRHQPPLVYELIVHIAYPCLDHHHLQRSNDKAKHLFPVIEKQFTGTSSNLRGNREVNLYSVYIFTIMHTC